MVNITSQPCLRTTKRTTKRRVRAGSQLVVATGLKERLHDVATGVVLKGSLRGNSVKAVTAGVSPATDAKSANAC